ncbi:MAG TPA: flavocytochrome C [Eubacteriaceae bacterium]|nr:flavocytochrome C [Eubacteriaceae bacterium]
MSKYHLRMLIYRQMENTKEEKGMKRKILCILMVLVFVFGLVACGGEESQVDEQTYTNTVKGYGGEVTVTVALSGEDITRVEAEGPKETEGIGSRAIEELPEAIAEKNSTDVEGVSGATVTSGAIKLGVEAALKEAAGEEADALSFEAGTYTAETFGNSSMIKVEVETSESEILDIKVVEHNETPILYDAAEELTIERVLESQSLAVDSVSGVTVSSNAILKATEKALSEAGENEIALNLVKEKEGQEAEEIEKSADVVVVGGGGAGLVAANAVAEEGASVLVLEKAPFLGGNLSVFGGIYNSPDEEKQSKVEMTDNVRDMIETQLAAEPNNEEHEKAIEAVREDYEQWKADGEEGLFDSASWFALQTWNSGDQVANKALVDQMTYNAFEGLNWLESIGVEFNDEITQGAGSLYQRTHGAVKPKGSGFVDAYVERLEEYGDQVEILMETPVNELILEGDQVVGVKAVDADGNTYNITANNGVVLATGGFAGNVELRQEYCEGEKWADLGPKVLTTNLTPITGDGILMARDIGANLVDMEHIQLLHLGNPFSGATIGVIPHKGRNADEVIFVNAQGDRFVAEDGRRDVMSNAILEQEGGFYWMIHDSKNIDPDSELVQNYLEGNYMYRADSLEELAEMIDVPAENLVSTVDQYNEAVQNGEDPELGRKLLVETIDEGPYFAAKRVPSAHHTMGGVQIDEETQMYFENGDVIKGLFAAGEVTGGIHGANRVGGNAVDDTVVFGRIAGENAAKNK